MNDQSENLPIPEEAVTSELSNALKGLENLIDSPHSDPKIIEALEKTLK